MNILYQWAMSRLVMMQYPSLLGEDLGSRTTGLQLNTHEAQRRGKNHGSKVL